MSPTLKIKMLHPDAITPTYAKEGDSGMDIAVIEDVVLYQHQQVMCKTGIAVELPPGYEIQVRSRSGLARKEGIAVLNSPGTVDNGYRGEIGIVLIKHTKGNRTIRKGEHVAQLVIAPVEQATIEVVEELTETERGTDGFGSTGTTREPISVDEQEALALAVLSDPVVVALITQGHETKESIMHTLYSILEDSDKPKNVTASVISEILQCKYKIESTSLEAETLEVPEDLTDRMNESSTEFRAAVIERAQAALNANFLGISDADLMVLLGDANLVQDVISEPNDDLSAVIGYCTVIRDYQDGGPSCADAMKAITADPHVQYIIDNNGTSVAHVKEVLQSRVRKSLPEFNRDETPDVIIQMVIDHFISLIERAGSNGDIRSKKIIDSLEWKKLQAPESESVEEAPVIEETPWTFRFDNAKDLIQRHYGPIHQMFQEWKRQVDEQSEDVIETTLGDWYEGVTDGGLRACDAAIVSLIAERGSDTKCHITMEIVDNTPTVLITLLNEPRSIDTEIVVGKSDTPKETIEPSVDSPESQLADILSGASEEDKQAMADSAEIAEEAEAIQEVADACNEIKEIVDPEPEVITETTTGEYPRGETPAIQVVEADLSQPKDVPEFEVTSSSYPDAEPVTIDMSDEELPDEFRSGYAAEVTKDDSTPAPDMEEGKQARVGIMRTEGVVTEFIDGVKVSETEGAVTEIAPSYQHGEILTQGIALFNKSNPDQKALYELAVEGCGEAEIFELLHDELVERNQNDAKVVLIDMIGEVLETLI